MKKVISFGIVIIFMSLYSGKTFAQGQFFMTSKKKYNDKSFNLKSSNSPNLEIKKDPAKIDTFKRQLLMGWFLFKKNKEYKNIAYGDSIWKENGDTLSRVLDRGATHIGVGINGEPIVATELFAGLLGNWRLAFGSTVVGSSASDTSKNNKSAQTFFNGGGNAYLMATLPLLHYDSERKNGKRGRYIYALLFNPKFGGNLPKGNASNKITDWTMDIGIEGHAQFATSNQEIGLVLKFRAAQVYGNQEYISSVSTGDNFRYVQLSAGIILNKSVLVNINLSPAITSKKSTIPSSIGVQLKF